MSHSLVYLKNLWRASLVSLRRTPRIYLVLLVIVWGIALFWMPLDRDLLQSIRSDPVSNPNLHQLAWWISWGTQYQFTPLLLCVGIWLAGLWRKRPSLKRAALVCLFAGTIGGLWVNVLRPGFGRPRPHADIPDRFYFFELNPSMNSFPSGHVLSNMAGATALTIVLPTIGAPYFVLSLASGWSRMQRNAHYPTDVAVGALLGLLIGLASARGARLLDAQADSLGKAAEPPSGPSSSVRNSTPPD